MTLGELFNGGWGISGSVWGMWDYYSLSCSSNSSINNEIWVKLNLEKVLDQEWYIDRLLALVSG